MPRVGLKGPRVFREPTQANSMILRQGSPVPSTSQQASPSEFQPRLLAPSLLPALGEVRADRGSVFLA